MKARRGPKAQPKELKEARSALCRAEMYRLFPNAKNPWALEPHIHSRQGSTNGIQNVTGRFFHLMDNNGTPSEEDCDAVDARLEERRQSAGPADGPLDSNLRKWAYCPIWALGSPNRGRDWCQNALRSLEPAVQRIVFIERSGSNPTTAQRRLLPETYFYLLQLGTWDAFVASLLLSDEAEVIGDPEGQRVALLCAYCCFPKAVRNETLLHSHWEKLALFLEPFFEPVLGHLQGDMPIAWFRAQIYADDLDPMPLAFKCAYELMKTSLHEDRVARARAELKQLIAPIASTELPAWWSAAPCTFKRRRR